MYAIKEAARRSGLKATTIRFYEAKGLVPSPERASNGRRLYSDKDVQRLIFIRHGRSFGFDLTQLQSLLNLSDHPDQPCGTAILIAKSHLVEVNQQLRQLSVLKEELTKLVKTCVGGKSAQCGVIRSLAEKN